MARIEKRRQPAFA